MTTPRAALLLLSGTALCRMFGQEIETVSNDKIHTEYFQEMPYPLGARLTHTEGAVVLRLKLDTEGKVLSSMAISGPKPLIADCLANSKKWRFKPNGTDSVVVIYVFRFEGLCFMPCQSQFLFHPPNLAMITVGDAVIDPYTTEKAKPDRAHK